MSKLQNLYEKRAALHSEFLQLDAAPDKSSEDRAKFEGVMDDIMNTDKEIETETRALEIRAAGARKIEQPKEAEHSAKEHRAALGRYMVGRATQADMALLEQRTNVQSTTTTGGGFTIPKDFRAELEIAQKYFNPFNREEGFDVFTTATGRDLPFPATNDTGNKGTKLAESTDAETGSTAVAFAQPITMKAYKYKSDLLRIPYELIEDSEFDIMQVITDLLGERLGRGRSYAFTKGAGSTDVHGIDTKIKATAALQVLPASNTGLVRTDILNLIYSVDRAYRGMPGAKLMFNDAILKHIASLTIGTGDDRPLWQPSMVGGVPATVEGVPYIINNNMDGTLVKTSLTMIYGDMSKYKIRMVNDIRVKVLTERYGEFDQTGIVLFERIDGQLLDAGTNPIKGLYHNKT